ncbi:MAG: copper resistance protein NlpE N-terminal domain-containing protein [Chitinophagaceae bacterium]
MKKIFYILLLPSLYLWACNNSASNKEQAGDSVVSKPVLIDSVALKSAGIYSGYVPCADCEGIITFLLLKPDMTYSMEETYYKKDEKVNLSNGVWKMNNGKLNLYAGDEVKVSFLTEGEKLMQLDHEGNRISGNLGDKFVLTRKAMADKNALKEKAAAGIDFTAQGSEPSWNLEIDKGNKIMFTWPGMKEPLGIPYTEPITSNGNREYHIDADGVKMDIVISTQFCSDGMSDFINEYKVGVQFRGNNYSGCGILLNSF